LDADWYDSTITCLEAFGKHVAPGGVILIDDYYTWDGCSKAVHDYLSRHTLPWRIRQADDMCMINV
jgi:O-methyltransferase